MKEPIQKGWPEGWAMNSWRRKFLMKNLCICSIEFFADDHLERVVSSLPFLLVTFLYFLAFMFLLLRTCLLCKFKWEQEAWLIPVRFGSLYVCSWDQIQRLGQLRDWVHSPEVIDLSFEISLLIESKSSWSLNSSHPSFSLPILRLEEIRIPNHSWIFDEEHYWSTLLMNNFCNCCCRRTELRACDSCNEGALGFIRLSCVTLGKKAAHVTPLEFERRFSCRRKRSLLGATTA